MCSVFVASLGALKLVWYRGATVKSLIRLLYGPFFSLALPVFSFAASSGGGSDPGTGTTTDSPVADGFLSTIGDGITGIVTWISSFWGNVGSAFIALFTWGLDALIYVIGYTVYTVFDGLLSMVELLFSGLGIATMLGNAFSQFAGLPDGMVWFLDQMGFFSGLTLIIGAIITRKIIDVVPGGWQV